MKIKKIFSTNVSASDRLCCYRGGVHNEGSKDHIDFIEDVSIISMEVAVGWDEILKKKKNSRVGNYEIWTTKYKINSIPILLGDSSSSSKSLSISHLIPPERICPVILELRFTRILEVN